MMKTNFKRKAIAALVTASLVNNVHGAPTLPQVVAGQATFGQQGNVFSITNTPNTIINWQSFSVNAGEITRFVQQSSDSTVLNRILGQDPSRILGALQSNGHVYLINPNGIMFGKDAKVDVNGLVASTLNISNSDFLAGKKIFSGTGGTISNAGSINGSKIFLIAPNIENSGVITSPSGEVVLAAGHSVELVDSGNPDLHVVVSAPADQAINLGQIVANRVGIYGALVNQRGIVNATAAAMEGGKVVFKASGDTLLEQGSVTSGHDVQVLGKRVALTGNAEIHSDGGNVLIGGDTQGKNPAVQNAEQTYVGENAVVTADGSNGGKIVVWADQTTQAYGSLSAGGAKRGFIETSGHYLDTAGIRVAGADWLIDPWDITIVAIGTPSNVVQTGTVWTGASSTAPSSTLLVSSLTNALNAGSDIAVNSGVDTSTGLSVGGASGGGNIVVSDPISWSGARTLTFNAYKDIAINGAISGAGGSLVLESFHGNVSQSAAITADKLFAYAQSGSVQLSNSSNAVNTLSGRTGSSGSFTFSNGGALTIGTAGGTGGIQTSGGAIFVDVPGSGGLTVSDAATGVDAGIGSVTLHSGGAVNLTSNAKVLGTGVTLSGSALNMASGTSVTDTGSTTFIADNMSLAGAITANAGISLLPNTSGLNIVLGAGATDSVNQLGLTETELATITTSNLSSGALIVAANGAGSITVGGSLDLATPDKIAGNVSLVTTGGNINVNGPLSVSNYLFVYAGSGTISNTAAITSTKQNIMLEADKMALGGSVTASSSGYNVHLLPTGAALELGTVGDTGSSLALSSAELAQVHTPTLMLGSAGVNDITVTGPVSIPNATQVSLYSPRDTIINSGAGLTVAGDLQLTGSGVFSNSGALSATNLYVSQGGAVINNGGTITANVAGISGLALSNSGTITANSLSVSTNTVNNAGTINSPTSMNLSALQITNSGSVTSPLLTLSAGVMALTGGTLNSTQRVRLSTGNSVLLGAASTDTTSGALELSTAELASVHAPLLQVSTSAGSVTVKAPLLGTSGGALSGISTLRLDSSGGTIAQDVNAIISGPIGLALYGGGINLAQANQVNVLAGTAGAAFIFHSAGALTIGSIDGLTGINAGTADLLAGGSSALTISQPISTAGAMVLTAGSAASADAGNVVTFDSNVSASTGTVTINAHHVAGSFQPTGTNVINNLYVVSTPPPSTAPPPPPPPTVNQCVADPSLSGCADVLPSLASCTTTPTLAGCSVVLPPLSTCTTAPSTAGCTAVLPSLAQCTATPTAAGCSAVLPPLTTCVATPTAAGCSAVLPTLPVCIATPTTNGCSVVLPTLSACIAAPATAGCSVVLPTLAACIATPTTAGCSVVLPTLTQCITNPTATGCTVVLPTLTACIASPTAAGCSVVLPSMATCIATPTAAGCSVVLPSLATCIAAPASAGCTVVLPTLSQCVATPSKSGCTVVLPTLAQCTASPTLQGCSVVLPPLSACAADPTTPGCSVVLPQPDFCATHPSDASCSAIDVGTKPESPVATATNTVVAIINTADPVATSAGSDIKKPDASKPGPDSKTDGANSVKDQPVKKLYCN